MQSQQTNSLPTKKRMRSSMALQVNSTGGVDIQVKMIRVQRDHQVVVLELQYGRHETGLHHATSWYRTLWKDSGPHETHLIKMHRPILKDMGDTIRQESL